MSDVGLSPDFSKGIAIAILALYFSPAGFLPGFYISYLLFTRKTNNLLFRILYSIFVGTGSVFTLWFILNYAFKTFFASYFIPGNVAPSNTALSNNDTFVTIPPYILYIVGLEVLMILIHFFYFRKPKKKTKSSSVKKMNPVK